MSLKKEDIAALADLARLELTDTEAASMVHDLDEVLVYVERLKEVGTEGVQPLTMPARAEGWREDVAFASDDATRELILANFPVKSGNLLKTPGVFENPKGKN